MRALRLLLTAVALTAAVPGASPAASGDALCDPVRSTDEVCLIVGRHQLRAPAALRFSRPDVRLEGRLAAPAEGRCAGAPETPCMVDPDCAALGPCERRARVEVRARRRLEIGPRGGITARGRARPGDAVGPPGGVVLLDAPEVRVAGRVRVEARGWAGIPAGPAGEILIDASARLTIEEGGALRASTSGGCGGRIVLGDRTAPHTLDARGQMEATGGGRGGVVRVTAVERLLLGGTVRASNTRRPRGARSRCAAGAGGGIVELRAARIALLGEVVARGMEAIGGRVHVTAEREVVLDAPGPRPAISVRGGDVDAFFWGGDVVIEASAGDVLLRTGLVEVSGRSVAAGSDAGTFEIVAGGDLVADVSLVARGGGGGGFGCPFCELSAAGSAVVSGPVDVGGGTHGGGDGDLLVGAGRDLTVGPGWLGADGTDGGGITLTAGEPASARPSVAGVLRVRAGTAVHADALAVAGFGGEIELEGCDVVLEPDASLSASGGRLGSAGGLQLVAREALEIGVRARLAATPDGRIGCAYRTTADVAPDVVFASPVVMTPNPGLPACAACDGPCSAVVVTAGAALEPLRTATGDACAGPPLARLGCLSGAEIIAGIDALADALDPATAARLRRAAGLVAREVARAAAAPDVLALRRTRWAARRLLGRLARIERIGAAEPARVRLSRARAAEVADAVVAVIGALHEEGLE
jgi:hypothetical protein